MNQPPDSFQDAPSLLLVDDDEVFCSVLARALERRGFQVRIAHSTEQGQLLAEQEPPEYAIIDLNMPGGSGLPLLGILKGLDENTRILVLTGYASIATAVEAIKLGAVHYLAKPADADEIVSAFERTSGDSGVAIAPQPMSVDRLEWEHIQKVLADCDGNISAAARHLNMHRRTLQRKLKKHPARR